MCVSCLSRCVPATLLEGRPLRTTAITLVALGVIALIVGTLASLSLQGTLRTSLTAVGTNGIAGLIGGGCFAVVLGYCLCPPKRKRQGQRVLFTPQQVQSIRESIEQLSAKDAQSTRIGSSEDRKSVIMLPQKLVPGYFFLKYAHPLTTYVDILGKGKDFFADGIIIASIETLELDEGVEVAVFKENPFPGPPRVQKDRSCYFQRQEGCRTHFGNLLRFICRERLYVGANLADYFPLSQEGKFIFLRLQRVNDVKPSIRHFFNAIPTAWYEEFGGILDEYGYAEVVSAIITDAATEREEREGRFQKYLDAKRIDSVAQEINYSGTDGELEDAVQKINKALQENQKHYLTSVYGRHVNLSIPANTLQKLKDAGLIWFFRSSGGPFNFIWC